MFLSAFSRLAHAPRSVLDKRRSLASKSMWTMSGRYPSTRSSGGSHGSSSSPSVGTKRKTRTTCRSGREPPNRFVTSRPMGDRTSTSTSRTSLLSSSPCSSLPRGRHATPDILCGPDRAAAAAGQANPPRSDVMPPQNLSRCSSSSACAASRAVRSASASGRRRQSPTSHPRRGQIFVATASSIVRGRSRSRP